MFVYYDQPICIGILCYVCRDYLLGRGRRSTIVGVDAGVFLVTLVLAVVAGAALPDRTCRFGELSRFDGAGPTDCDRSAL